MAPAPATGTSPAVATAAAPPAPTPRHSAWLALLRASTAVQERMERALAEQGLPPLGWYDVLATLERGPEGGLRPRELVSAVTVTKSGLTRLLDRIEGAGLIERRPCPEDRRGSHVLLTAAGAEMADRMAPVKHRVFEDHFASHVSEAEAETIRAALDRVAESAYPAECADADDERSEAAEGE